MAQCHVCQEMMAATLSWKQDTAHEATHEAWWAGSEVGGRHGRQMSRRWAVGPRGGGGAGGRLWKAGAMQARQQAAARGA